MGAWAMRWRDLREKMVKDPLSADRVAAGWALGMFIGCTIPFGFQLVISVPLSFVFRVSKIGATVGTLITNPVSIFFIYPAQTMLAAKLFGRDLSWSVVKTAMEGVARQGDWQSLLGLSGELVFCFLFGGLVLAMALTPLTYVLVRGIVTRHRTKREAR